MVGVAQRGTASCCIGLNNGISVAAKTGTAQLNGPGEPERSHVWIVAYAPVEDPKYVVAVMLKGTNEEISASTGGRLAGPIAKAMLDEAFRIDAERLQPLAAASPQPLPPATPPPAATTPPPRRRLRRERRTRSKQGGRASKRSGDGELRKAEASSLAATRSPDRS